MVVVVLARSFHFLKVEVQGSVTTLPFSHMSQPSELQTGRLEQRFFPGCAHLFSQPCPLLLYSVIWGAA